MTVVSVAADRRRMKLKRRYGMTPEEWDALYDKQRGLCAICFYPFDKGHMHTDHEGPYDSEDRGWNGKPVRGLLCGPCNMRLGWYEANKETVDAYLAK